MPEILKSLWDLIIYLPLQYYGWLQSIAANGLAEVLMVGTIVGGFAGVKKTINSHWLLYRQQEPTMISFSLNQIKDGHLYLTSMLEDRPVHEVFPNPVHQKIFVKAARKTTRGNPIMEFPAKHEMRMLMILQKAISARYSTGAMAAASGVPVHTSVYIFTPTCEKYSRKQREQVEMVRVITTHPYCLAHIPPDEQVEVDEPHHIRRLTTMRLIEDYFARLSEVRKRRHRVRLQFQV